MTQVRSAILAIISILLLFTNSVTCASPLKVGISLVDLSNPFFAILAEQISRELKDHHPDEMEILMHSSAYNLEKQIAQLDDFIEKQVDMIFVAASETEAIAPFVQRARARGIIVVAVDIESTGADIIVTSDNIQAGRLACDYLAQKLHQRGKVAIINGQHISSTVNRVDGCKQALNNYPAITLVSDSHNSSGTYSGGLESMTYLMIEYPDLQGIFAINDPSAFGAAEATEQLGRRDINIVAVDASPEFLSQLNQKETNFIASTAQFPTKMAKRAVELGLLQLKNNNNKQKVELIETELVTKDNASSYSNWQPVDNTQK